MDLCITDAVVIRAALSSQIQKRTTYISRLIKTETISNKLISLRHKVIEARQLPIRAYCNLILCKFTFASVTWLNILSIYFICCISLK